tara:strand:- start:482 stop:673 length:192 start_codon:yes stop_codon:yes gene_type:complete
MESYMARQLKRHIETRDNSLINITQLHKDIDKAHQEVRDTEAAIANLVKEEKLYEQEPVDLQA